MMQLRVLCCNDSLRCFRPVPRTSAMHIADSVDSTIRISTRIRRLKRKRRFFLIVQRKLMKVLQH